jgi:hypothetical protein
MIITAIRTEQADNGLTVIKDAVHVKKGEIYPTEQVNFSGNSLTIFWDGHIIKGVTTNLDKDAVEILAPELIKKPVADNTSRKPGCGTCGGRGH